MFRHHGPGGREHHHHHEHGPRGHHGGDHMLHEPEPQHKHGGPRGHQHGPAGHGPPGHHHAPPLGDSNMDTIEAEEARQALAASIRNAFDACSEFQDICQIPPVPEFPGAAGGGMPLPAAWPPGARGGGGVRPMGPSVDIEVASWKLEAVTFFAPPDNRGPAPNVEAVEQQEGKQAALPEAELMPGSLEVADEPVMVRVAEAVEPDVELQQLVALVDPMPADLGKYKHERKHEDKKQRKEKHKKNKHHSGDGAEESEDEGSDSDAESMDGPGFGRHGGPRGRGPRPEMLGRNGPKGGRVECSMPMMRALPPHRMTVAREQVESWEGGAPGKMVPPSHPHHFGHHHGGSPPFGPPPPFNHGPLHSPALRCIMEQSRQPLASGTCQAAVLQVQSAADALRATEMEDRPHLCGGALVCLLLLGAVVAAVVRAIVKRHRAAKRAVRFWRAIDRDPHLKAQVEAAAGEPLPTPPRHNPGHCAGACTRFTLRVLAVAALVLGMQFAVLAAVAVLSSDGDRNDDAGGSSGSDSDAAPEGLVFTFMPFGILLWWGIVAVVFLAFRAASGTAAAGSPSASVPLTAPEPASAPARPAQERWQWQMLPQMMPGRSAAAPQGYQPMTGTASAEHAGVYVPPEVPEAGATVV